MRAASAMGGHCPELTPRLLQAQASSAGGHPSRRANLAVIRGMDCCLSRNVGWRERSDVDEHVALPVNFRDSTITDDRCPVAEPRDSPVPCTCASRDHRLKRSFMAVTLTSARLLHDELPGGREAEAHRA
jgi:hypothetical protein